MVARVKRLLSVLGVLAALGMFAGLGNATTIVLCTETASGGCVAGLSGTEPVLTVASDGEVAFDPFGFGGDTSDGIQLNASWVTDPAFAASFGAGLWTQIPGTFTWVLPATITGCGSENEPTCEPVAKWYFPGALWVSTFPGFADTQLIRDPGGLSDVILLTNTGPGGSAAITFYSDPATFPSIPEPASLALLGIGMAGLAFARRRKS